MYKIDDVVVALVGLCEEVCIVVDREDATIFRRLVETTYILKTYDKKYDHVAFGDFEFNQERQQYETSVEEGLVRNMNIGDLDEIV